MSRSYDTYDTQIQYVVEQLVSDDFDGHPFNIESVEGTVTLTATVSVALPDGWEFADYNDTLEISREVNF